MHAGLLQALFVVVALNVSVAASAAEPTPAKGAGDVAPTPQATKRLSVTVLINFRSLSPAIACIPSDMFFIPSKNNPSPPMTATMSEIISTKVNMLDFLLSE